MTTPQIYALFAMLTTAALAAFIFYCIGLRTGRDAGETQAKEKARAACEELLQHRIAEAEELRNQLDARTREAMTLRNNIKAEAEDHAKVERGLLNRLAAAAPLSDEDHAVMLAAGAKLELAALAFSCNGSHEHARACRPLMAQVLDIADRIKKAQANTQPHPDSELIDWLEATASIGFDFETATLCFDCNPAELNPVGNSLRSIVRLAMEQSERDGFDAADAEDAA